MPDEKKFTDADLQAAGAAGALAMREAAAEHMMLRADTYSSVPDIAVRMQSKYKVDIACAAMSSEARDGARSIRALPLPNPAALAAAVAEAVAKEREACAQLCDALETFGDNAAKRASDDEYGGGTAKAWARAAESLAGQIRTRPTGGGSGT